MHIYTLVITPGPRRTAIDRAEALLAEAVPSYCDYSRAGGAFAERLGNPHRPEIDTWYAARDERRERFEAADPVEVTFDVEYDLRELRWSNEQEPYQEQLRRLERAALADLICLTSKLPSPLPERLIPAALVTPDGRWRCHPSRWRQGDPRWSRWINATVDRYRGGHCVVVADCHC